MIANMEVQLLFLRPPIMAFSPSNIFRDELVSFSTTKPKNVFVLSKNGSNFAANCAVAKIFTKPINRKRFMFLHSSRTFYSVFANKKRIKRIPKHEGSGFKIFWVKLVAKNENKKAEIGKKYFEAIGQKKSEPMCRTERYLCAVHRSVFAKERRCVHAASEWSQKLKFKFLQIHLAHMQKQC